MKIILALLITPLSLLIYGQSFSAETRFLSAGIGDQRQEVRSDYSLNLVLFVDSGGLLTNIDVNIVNEDGDAVLQMNSYGPWFYVEPPAGRYNVNARRQNGDIQNTDVLVTGSEQTTMALMFPDR